MESINLLPKIKNTKVPTFYRPQRWTQSQVQEERYFTIELALHDIHLIALPNFSGRNLHNDQDYAFALFPAVGGRQFEVDNLE